MFIIHATDLGEILTFWATLFIARAILGRISDPKMATFGPNNIFLPK
jgi:hypothetical protein